MLYYYLRGARRLTDRFARKIYQAQIAGQPGIMATLEAAGFEDFFDDISGLVTRLDARLVNNFKNRTAWPTVYETLRTRFVRNKIALQQFEIFLEIHHDIVFLNDHIYRNDAFDLAIESSLRRGRPLSMADCLLRLIIDDPNVRINYFLTFNQPDFIDLCKKNRVELL